MKLFHFLLCCSISIFGVTTGQNNIGINFKRTRQSVASNAPESALSNAQKRIALGMTKIAVNIDYILSRTASKDGNIIIAPINIFKTLATVMLGTAGATEKELSNFLGGLVFGRKISEGSELLHREIGKLLVKVTDVSPGVQFGNNLNIAGAIFVQSGSQVNPRYIEMAKSIYKSDVIELDFARDGINSAIAINQWVSNHTENRIKEIVQPPVNPLTKLIIAGALYFNGDWEHPFLVKATKWQPFYLGNEGRFAKESVQVQLMVNQAAIPYFEDKEIGYQAIGIPYKNKEVYMYVVLPRLNLSLKNLTAKLMYKDIDNIIHNSKTSEVFYVIPKMQLENNINLRGAMESQGVKTLFNPVKANFSNLADGIYVSEILHKVEMDINEIGTTATAATMISMNRGGYINFRADRPFFFFIYNTKAEVMTFWGSIQKPTPFK